MKKLSSCIIRQPKRVMLKPNTIWVSVIRVPLHLFLFLRKNFFFFFLHQPSTEGDGVEQDNEKAFRFYLRAANQMHKQAQYYVGLFYKEGKGVDQNIYEAIHWFRKAAGQGTETSLRPN